MNRRKLWQFGVFSYLSIYLLAMLLPRELPFNQISTLHTNVFKKLFSQMLYYGGPLEPVANFLLLMPVFAILIHYLHKSRAVSAFYICVALSGTVELVQKLIPGRVSSLKDFLLNSAGAVIAFLVFKVKSKAKEIK